MAKLVNFYNNDFDRVAEVWEKSRKVPISTLAPLLSYCKGEVVLDAGCGNGRNTAVLVNYFEKVYGIDLSPKLVEFAKKRLGKTASLQVGSITALPYRSEFFDCVFSLAVFHHLDSELDRRCAFREIFKVLKKGGFFLVSVRSKFESKVKGRKVIYTHWLNGFKVYNYLYSEKEFIKFARQAGFKVVKCFWEKNGREVAKDNSSNLCCVFQKK